MALQKASKMVMVLLEIEQKKVSMMRMMRMTYHRQKFLRTVRPMMMVKMAKKGPKVTHWK